MLNMMVLAYLHGLTATDCMQSNIKVIMGVPCMHNNAI